MADDQSGVPNNANDGSGFKNGYAMDNSLFGVGSDVDVQTNKENTLDGINFFGLLDDGWPSSYFGVPTAPALSSTPLDLLQSGSNDLVPSLNSKDSTSATGLCFPTVAQHLPAHPQGFRPATPPPSAASKALQAAVTGYLYAKPFEPSNIGDSRSQYVSKSLVTSSGHTGDTPLPPNHPLLQKSTVSVPPPPTVAKPSKRKRNIKSKARPDQPLQIVDGFVAEVPQVSLAADTSAGSKAVRRPRTNDTTAKQATAPPAASKRKLDEVAKESLEEVATEKTIAGYAMPVYFTPSETSESVSKKNKGRSAEVYHGVGDIAKLDAEITGIGTGLIDMEKRAELLARPKIKGPVGHVAWVFRTEKGKASQRGAVWMVELGNPLVAWPVNFHTSEEGMLIVREYLFIEGLMSMIYRHAKPPHQTGRNAPKFSIDNIVFITLGAPVSRLHILPEPMMFEGFVVSQEQSARIILMMQTQLVATLCRIASGSKTAKPSQDEPAALDTTVYDPATTAIWADSTGRAVGQWDDGTGYPSVHISHPDYQYTDPSPLSFSFDEPPMTLPAQLESHVPGPSGYQDYYPVMTQNALEWNALTGYANPSRQADVPEPPMSVSSYGQFAETSAMPWNVPNYQFDMAGPSAAGPSGYADNAQLGVQNYVDPQYTAPVQDRVDASASQWDGVDYSFLVETATGTPSSFNAQPSSFR